jgi:hypothetical protein
MCGRRRATGWKLASEKSRENSGAAERLIGTPEDHLRTHEGPLMTNIRPTKIGSSSKS